MHDVTDEHPAGLFRDASRNLSYLMMERIHFSGKFSALDVNFLPLRQNLLFCFRRGHTILALVCIVAILSFIVFTEEESEDVKYNAKRYDDFAMW